MWLTCKKEYKDRIMVGKKYKVILKKTFKGGIRDGERYWLFEIPQPEIKENPVGSGWFDIDEYFETPEEERENKINQVLCLN